MPEKICKAGEGAPADLAQRLRLVAITPGGLAAAEIAARTRSAVSGGATAVMLRDPGLGAAELVRRGRALAALAAELRFFFILNGEADLALQAGAAAAHLGSRTERPAAAAARARDSGLLLGYSAHHPFESHAGEIAACAYATYSPVFPTTSKPGAPSLGVAELCRAAQNAALPVVALGGIGRAEARLLGCAGCACVAAISGVMDAPEPAAAAAALLAALSAGEAEAGRGARGAPGAAP